MGQTRIMFIENKDGESNLTGDARIGLVTFSKTKKSIHYKGQTFERISGFKANYRDVETGTHTGFQDVKKTVRTDYMENDFRF
jgi:hypothetical protein